VKSLRRSLLSAAVLGLCLSTASFTGCAEDECSVDSDCATNRICRNGLCVLDPTGPIGGDADGGGSDIGADVNLPCEPAQLGDFVLTEILADPGGKDPDGDGNPDNSDDEFIEFVNVSSRTVALTNVSIEVAGKGVTQLPAVCLDPNGAYVLWGKDANEQLTNSGGTVRILVSGSVDDTHQYVETNDESTTRQDQLDKDSIWVDHSSISDRDFSPGTCPNGNAFPNCSGGPIGDATGDTDAGSTDAEVTPPCTGSVPTATDLIINEIMSDPGSLDTNGDGTPDTSDDEFIEIVSLAAGTLDLSGLVVTDESSGNFVIPAGTCLEPNQALVLINEYDASNSNADFGTAVVLGMGNPFALNNSSDTVFVNESTGGTIVSLSYGSAANDNQSVVRETDLDPNAALVKHSEAPNSNGALFSPGFCQNGQAFPNCAAATPDAAPDAAGDVTGDGVTTDGGGGDGGPTDADSTDATDVTATPDGTADGAADITTGDAPMDVSMDMSVDQGPDAAPCGPVAGAASLAINEVMANPNDGNGGFDFNGDGGYTANGDEYIEIVNITGGSLDVNGVQVQVDTGNLDTKHTVSMTGCLPPQGALLIFGPGTPSVTVGVEVMVFGADKTLSLNNGGDEIALLAADGLTVIDTYTFGSASAAESFVADPDGSDNLVLHSTATNSAGVKASPGTCIDGSAFTECLP